MEDFQGLSYARPRSEMLADLGRVDQPQVWGEAAEDLVDRRQALIDHSHYGPALTGQRWLLLGLLHQSPLVGDLAEGLLPVHGVEVYRASGTARRFLSWPDLFGVAFGR